MGCPNQCSYTTAAPEVEKTRLRASLGEEGTVGEGGYSGKRTSNTASCLGRTARVRTSSAVRHSVDCVFPGEHAAS